MPLLDVDPLDFSLPTLDAMAEAEQMEIISWVEHHLDLAEARYHDLVDLSARISLKMQTRVDA